MSNSIYDPIANALGMEPIEFKFDISSFISTRIYHGKELSPFYGQKHTEESKQLMSRVRIERGCFKGEKNPMYGKTARPMLGKSHTEESKKKMSMSAKSRGSNRTGSIHTPNQRKNISEGIHKLEPLKCPHCDMASKNRSNMNRYHFDNCKNKPNG
jgi:ribosomal protein L37AE/L43A